MPEQELFAKTLLFAVPLLTSSVTLAALHWMPWNKGLQPLKNTTAYALGTLVTVGVPSVALLVAALLDFRQGELFWAALLITNALVSGATVHVCYWIDSLLTRPLNLDEVHDARNVGN